MTTVEDADVGYEDKWRAFTAIAIAFVTSVMSTTMVFVSLPSIADEFGITLRAVAWVVIVQSLTISSLMLPMGRVADMVGRKRMHLIGMTVFAVGSVAVAAAPTFGLVIAGRTVMGMGNAMTQSVGTAMVVAVFPEHERGKAVGSQTTAVAIGAAMGPIVGGLLLQVFPWQALFLLIPIPIAVAFVAGYVVLDESKVTPSAANERPPFDWIGAGLSALMVFALVLTVNNPLAVPWLSPTIVLGTIATIGLLVAFVLWELRIDEPMLDLRLFSNSVLSNSIGARLSGFMGATVVLFLVPIFLISLRGLSEAAAGAVLFLNSLGMGLSAQIAGRLSDRFGTRLLGSIGFVLLVATALPFAFMTRETPLLLVTIVVLVNGLSFGMWNVPNNSTIMGSVPSSRHGVIGAFTNLVRNMGNVTGQALGSAVIVGLMVSRGFDVPLSDLAESAGASEAFIDGWRLSFLIVAALAVVALVLTQRAKAPPPAPR